jgi:hypothetical protein
MLARASAVMANIPVKRFNWLKRPSAWDRAQAWRERQQEMREKFESANSAAANAFGTASINLVTGLGSIVAKKASQRMQLAAIAKQLNILA